MVSSFHLVSYLHINLPPHFGRMNLLQTRKVFIAVIINSLNKSEIPSPLVHNYNYWRSLHPARRPQLPRDPGQLFPKTCKLRVWFPEFLDSFGVSLLSLYPAARARYWRHGRSLPLPSSAFSTPLLLVKDYIGTTLTPLNTSLNPSLRSV